jgi:histidinol-phosphate aminotransferase
VAQAHLVREVLRDKGFAVRRGDTFPGLGPEWLRVAVRDKVTTDAFGDALGQALRRVARDEAGLRRP